MQDSYIYIKASRLLHQDCYMHIMICINIKVLINTLRSYTYNKVASWKV